MHRKFLFFINPISGTANKLNLEKKIIGKCSEQNAIFQILYTSEDGNYSFLPEKINNDAITDIIICGGDGSLRPVISTVLNTKKVNIGIIPLGSGNGLAFTAKIPRSVDKALDVIFKGKTSCVDAFFINGNLSCMLCGIGLDAQVAYDFSLQQRRGLTTYIKQSFKNFITASPYHFELKVQGIQFKTDAYFICIANSNQFGNNFTIAPQASLNDGLLDIIVVKKMNKVKIVWSVLMQMKAGKTSRYNEKDFHNKDILYFQTDKLQISNPQMAPLHIDGDHMPTNKKFDIEVLPSAFHLLIP